MAQKPDGKSGRTERVTFTRPAAERIGKAVRIVESGDRKSSALRFGAHVAPIPSLRIGTFTGNWYEGQPKAVTILGTTSTINVTQFLGYIPDLGTEEGCEREVIFGSAGGTQNAVAIQFKTTCTTCQLTINPFDLSELPYYNFATQQILGHDADGCLRWYGVTDCP